MCDPPEQQHVFFFRRRGMFLGVSVALLPPLDDVLLTEPLKTKRRHW